jgi:hypothetical protein
MAVWRSWPGSKEREAKKIRRRLGRRWRYDYAFAALVEMGEAEEDGGD